MTRREKWWLSLVLLALGAGWGLTQPLAKMAINGGYEPLGMVFFQFLIGTLALGAVQVRRLHRIPVTRQSFVVWVMLASIGTIVPNTASYEALKTLPAGIYSVLLTTIPLLSFPMAIAFGNEIFAKRRLVGLLVGMVGVGFIVIPDASLPERAMLLAVPLAMVAPLCYALEGNLVARFGTGRLDPIQVMFGASALGMALSLPMALATDQFRLPTTPYGVPDVALILSALIHSFVYCGYVWIVGRAGPLFAAQVSYWVTGFGMFWAMILLGERYSGWVWLAMVLMIIGLTLVQPRRALASLRQGNDTNNVPST